MWGSDIEEEALLTAHPPREKQACADLNKLTPTLPSLRTTLSPKSNQVGTPTFKPSQSGLFSRMGCRKSCRFCVSLILGSMLVILLIIYVMGKHHFNMRAAVYGTYKPWQLPLSSTQKTGTDQVSSSLDGTMKLKRRQEERKGLIRSLCIVNSTLQFPGKDVTFDDIPIHALDHLIVDDRHKIIYCNVAKVASSNWKRVMLVLTQKQINGVTYTIPEDIPSGEVHAHPLHFTFDKFRSQYGVMSRDVMNNKLKEYTKFLFVRDPFVRLVSAFRNKFEEKKDYFYRVYARRMLRKYGKYPQPPASVKKAFEAGIRLNFTHFIQYLLDPATEKRTPYDAHWRQMYRMCYPCQINYDFVGKLETLDEDTEHLLRILHLDNEINFPVSNHKRTTSSLEQKYFASIPYKWRKKLYKLYEPDFQLFGYAKPKELLRKTLKE